MLKRHEEIGCGNSPLEKSDEMCVCDCVFMNVRVCVYESVYLCVSMKECLRDCV